LHDGRGERLARNNDRSASRRTFGGFKWREQSFSHQCFVKLVVGSRKPAIELCESLA
jgi:hypothetical protein